MKKRNIKSKTLAIILTGLLALSIVSGCSNSSDTDTSTVSNTASQGSISSSSSDNEIKEENENNNDDNSKTESSTSSEDDKTVSEDDMFSKRDLSGEYTKSECTEITLSGNSASSDSDSVTVSDDTITITAEGYYILSGNYSGSVIIDAAEDAKIQLILNNANIESSDFAAIYAKNADKVFITLADGTTNTLKNNGAYTQIDDNNVDSAVFAKCDITFNGTGTVDITSADGHAIAAKDDLVFADGTYNVTSADSAVTANNSIRIQKGTYTVNAASGDGLHCEDEDNDSHGWIYILDGTFNINASGDGISAGTTMQIENGTFTIKTGGGSNQTEFSSNEGGFDRFENFGNRNANQNNSQSTESNTTDSTSSKGIKSGGDMTIKNGTFSLDCLDDGVRSNSSLNVTGGTFTISTDDTGFQSAENLVISDGTITVSRSYEGMQGKVIDIKGGKIDITSYDDGLNAASGTNDLASEGMFGGMDEAESGVELNISGGELIINASGDGLDSNGNLTVTGGTTYVSGPTDSGNAAIDYAGTGTITGGIVIAAGSSGMAQSFSSASSQCSILASTSSHQANTEIKLTDSSGNVIIDWTSPKTYDCIVISAPDLAVGNSYTLTAGTYSGTINLDSTSYSDVSGGMGGRGGRMR